MLIGTHCSISGGVENAIIQAEELGIHTFQIFTKNQRQWREKEYTVEESARFREALRRAGIKIAFSHTPYLINLASANDEIREKSILGLASELLRCEALGLPYTVLHPGANKQISEMEAIARIADALNIVVQHTESLKAMVLLENTAGQGSSIGYRFEHHKAIMERVDTDKIGVCFDTCHAFAAGYDIRTREGLETLMSNIDQLVGLDKIKAFHFNDSKGALGSRLDRHAHIGEGRLGLEPFRQIIRQFPLIPKVLETSKENDMDRKNLALLKGLNDSDGY